MKVDFRIEEREFVKQETGEKIKYFAPVVILEEKQFTLQVRKEDKNLFNYLVKQAKKK